MIWLAVMEMRQKERALEAPFLFCGVSDPAQKLSKLIR